MIRIKQNVAYAQSKCCWFSIQLSDTMIWFGRRKKYYALFTMRIFPPAYHAEPKRVSFNWHGLTAK